MNTHSSLRYFHRFSMHAIHTCSAQNCSKNRHERFIVIDKCVLYDIRFVSLSYEFNLALIALVPATVMLR